MSGAFVLMLEQTCVLWLCYGLLVFLASLARRRKEEDRWLYATFMAVGCSVSMWIATSAVYAFIEVVFIH